MFSFSVFGIKFKPCVRKRLVGVVFREFLLGCPWQCDECLFHDKLADDVPVFVETCGWHQKNNTITFSKKFGGCVRRKRPRPIFVCLRQHPAHHFERHRDEQQSIGVIDRHVNVVLQPTIPDVVTHEIVLAENYFSPVIVPVNTEGGENLDTDVSHPEMRLGNIRPHARLLVHTFPVYFLALLPAVVVAATPPTREHFRQSY